MVVGYDAKELELERNLKTVESVENKRSALAPKNESSDDETDNGNSSSSSSTDVEDDDGGDPGQIVSARYEGGTGTTLVEAKNSVVHVGDKNIIINKLNVPIDLAVSNGTAGISQFLESLDYDYPPTQDKFEEEQKKVSSISGLIIKAMAIGVTLTLVLVGFIVILQLMQISGQNIPQDSRDNGTAGYNGTWVERSLCHLPSPTLPIRNMTTIPPTAVVISHTDTNECFALPYCCTMVENVWSYQTAKKGFSDIGYHYLVGGDGRIYEGRKWYLEGAHTLGWNCIALGISFIGNFVNQVPTDKQISGCVDFLKTLVKIGRLDANYSLYYHKQMSNTESPGAELIDIIKTWDHWTSNVTRPPCH